MSEKTTKEIFNLHINNDGKRFEFTPIRCGFTSYTVSFDEVGGNTQRAWTALYKALEREKKKPRTRFCWHCARKLHGNTFTEYESENGKVIVHKACLEILEGGFNCVKTVDDVDYEE